MESSPLNQAHREQRRAESFQRGGKLKEAAECHGKAAELLKTALDLTKNILARQSIILQYDHHLRQHHLFRFRSKQLEKFMKAMENQRVKVGSVSGSNSSGSGSGSSSRELPSCVTSNSGKKAHIVSLEMAKNAEKFDSLLDRLIAEGNGLKNHHCQTGSSESQEVTAEVKNPATTETLPGAKELAGIVEELRSLRDHQTDLITQLIAELSSTEKENSLLKAQVRELQARCEGYESERRRLRAMADSSCSPFVFSPLSEFSPDPPNVPDLAPLEMPPLDFLDNHEADS